MKRTAAELKRDVFAKLRTDPELADWVFIVQGQEIRAPGNVLRAASEVLFDMLGECGGSSAPNRCPLPDFITPQGFNAILDFILSPPAGGDGDSVGLLDHCAVSRETGKDTYCAAAVEVMVAADHLRVPGLVKLLGEDVMHKAREGRINVLHMWSLLDSVGTQGCFVLLLQQLHSLIAEHAGFWLCETGKTGVPFSACLTSAQLGELISTALATDCRDEPRLATALFGALHQWCRHRQRAAQMSDDAARDPGGGGLSGMLDDHLRDLFKLDHLCRGMTPQYIKTIVLPSGLVPRELVMQAFQEMACTAEALGINFMANANIMSEVYLRQSYVTWEVRPRKVLPVFPVWTDNRARVPVEPPPVSEDWDNLVSERFPLAGRFWQLQTVCQEDKGRQHLYLYLLPASKANLWGNQSGNRIDCNLVLLRQPGLRSRRGIGDVVKRITWTYMKEEVMQQTGRGYAMTDMDSVLNPANSFISSARYLLVQARLHRDEPLFQHAAQTKMRRAGEHPDYPFPWDPEQGFYIRNHG